MLERSVKMSESYRKNGVGLLRLSFGVRLAREGRGFLDWQFTFNYLGYDSLVRQVALAREHLMVRAHYCVLPSAGCFWTEGKVSGGVVTFMIRFG